MTQKDTKMEVHVLEVTEDDTAQERLEHDQDEDIFTDGARDGPGFVYLLSEHNKTGGHPTSYYKIGVSSQPSKRKADLQTGNPRPLYFKGQPTRVTKILSAERSIHKAVASYAISLGGGQEWFCVPQQNWEHFWDSYQKAINLYTASNEH